MELNHETITTPPQDAASVLLLRDSPEGLQVLLLRRHQASQVLGGAYVFPGGKLDAEDRADNAIARMSEAPQRLRERLGEDALDPAHAAGLFMAALREAFEECNVLVGQDRQGPAASGELPRLARTQGWHAALQQTGLTLCTEALLPWSRWITPRQPSVVNKRFDTRFFVAGVDPDQEAMHDNHETTDSVWTTPQQALLRYADGEIDLVAPQIMSLYNLKAHDTLTQALDEARQKPPALIEPHPFDEDGHRVLCYPGDPGHPLQSRAMRGPTRLLFVKGRFVPEGGMQVLLG